MTMVSWYTNLWLIHEKGVKQKMNNLNIVYDHIVSFDHASSKDTLFLLFFFVNGSNNTLHKT